MIHLQQTRDEVFQNTSNHQHRIKKVCGCKTKVDDFKIGDVVFRWDDRNEEKGKHGKL